ncbi:hypothetical protein H0H92_010829 [Tricholoma furcatifolium]|nr:hypothetical protein H0H92_010829 [Tricholoma furcatifolium]
MSPFGRVFAIKTIQKQESQSPATTSSSDSDSKSHSAWLSGLIDTAKAIQELGKLAPVPYAEIAAGVVVQILLRVQAMQNNIDDFRDLSQSLVDIIVIMRDTLLRYNQRRSDPPPEITRYCNAFIDELLKLHTEMMDTCRKNESWTSRFLKAATTAKEIGRYHNRINNMRLNFVVGMVIRTELRCAEQQVPHHLVYTANLVYLVDAMNDMAPVPMDQCRTQKDDVLYPPPEGVPSGCYDIVYREETQEVFGCDDILYPTPEKIQEVSVYDDNPYPTSEEEVSGDDLDIDITHEVITRSAWDHSIIPHNIPEERDEFEDLLDTGSFEIVRRHEIHFV